MAQEYNYNIYVYSLSQARNAILNENQRWLSFKCKQPDKCVFAKDKHSYEFYKVPNI